MKSLKTLLLTIGLTVTAVSVSRGGLGWTYAESVRAYGEPIRDIGEGSHGHYYLFFAEEYMISATFRNGKMCDVTYWEIIIPSLESPKDFLLRTPSDVTYKNTIPLTESRVDAFLAGNCPAATWSAPETTSYDKRWTGMVNGKAAYQVSLGLDRKALSICTQEYHDMIINEINAERTTEDNAAKGL